MNFTWTNTDRAIARSYEQQLTRLLDERFGVRQGTLTERITHASAYLPDTRRERLEELARELALIQRGEANIAHRDTWRARVEATLAAVTTGGPYVRATPRRRLGWLGHTAILASAAFLYRNLPEFFGITPSDLVDRIAIWVALGYLYWAWDRGLQMGWPPSRSRAVLRCVLFVLAASSPIAIGLGVLNLRHYARSNPVGYPKEESRDSLEFNPGSGWAMTPLGFVDVAGNPRGSDDVRADDYLQRSTEGTDPRDGG